MQTGSDQHNSVKYNGNIFKITENRGDFEEKPLDPWKNELECETTDSNAECGLPGDAHFCCLYPAGVLMGNGLLHTSSTYNYPLLAVSELSWTANRGIFVYMVFCIYTLTFRWRFKCPCAGCSYQFTCICDISLPIYVHTDILVPIYIAFVPSFRRLVSSRYERCYVFSYINSYL